MIVFQVNTVLILHAIISYYSNESHNESNKLDQRVTLYRGNSKEGHTNELKFAIFEDEGGRRSCRIDTTI